MEFLEKITAYPNEAIHDDYVIVFTGGYEKIANENKDLINDCIDFDIVQS